MSIRSDRMMNSAPDYYQQSEVFQAIQQAQADEYDSQAAKLEDLRAQLYITTATWGLKYWEAATGIPTILTDTYEARRARVLAKWRGVGNFNAGMVKSVAEAYSGAQVAVAFNPAAYELTITFVSPKGIPPGLDDIQASLANIVHAHLGVEYVVTYTTVAELKAQALTVAELKALGLTAGELVTHEF